MIDNILLSALDGTLPSSQDELTNYARVIFEELKQTKDALAKVSATGHEIATVYLKAKVSLLEDLGIELSERIDIAISNSNRRKQFQL